MRTLPEEHKRVSIGAGRRLLYLILSFIIVAWGQPIYSSLLSILAAVCGYAIFWRAMISLNSLNARFWLAAVWFGAIHAIQSSWFATTTYHGFYIYLGYCLVVVAVGAQFGVVSTLIPKHRPLTFFRMVMIASGWTLMEWVRLLPLSGWPMNPVGLAFSGSLYSLQAASLFGVYGLSFLVILTNLQLFRLWRAVQKRRPLLFWLAIVALPFLYGGGAILYHTLKADKPQKQVRVLLVQTAISLEDKVGFSKDGPVPYMPLTQQWERILSMLQPYYPGHYDIVAFPEFAVPAPCYTPIYPIRTFNALFDAKFGNGRIDAQPPLAAPFAEQAEENWYVSNAFFVQTLANLFESEVVIGLDRDEVLESTQGSHLYNSAWVFYPKRLSTQSPFVYDKNVLVPFGEYIPFWWLESLARRFGVEGSFRHGQDIAISKGYVDIGIAICFESMLPSFMQRVRESGAELFIVVTNDAWFPNSFLREQHAEHDRLRTVECGIPMLRVANTGVTVAFSSLGETIAAFPEGAEGEWSSGALELDFSLYTYRTLYSVIGDGPLLGFCLFCIFVFFRGFRLGLRKPRNTQPSSQ